MILIKDMKNQFLLLLVFITTPLLAISYDYTELWQKKELQIIEKQDLRSLLDAGIVPFRFPSMEKMNMSFKHINLSLIDPHDRTTPYFPVETGDLMIFKPGVIKRLLLRSRRMTIEEGRAEMFKWVYLSNKTESDIIEYLKVLEAYSKSMSFDDPPAFSLGTLFSYGETRVDYYVHPTRGYYDPLRLVVKVTWNPFKAQKDYNLFNEPIPQPSGYEHISFDAPKKFGPDSLDEVLRFKQEYAKLKGLPIPEHYEMPPIPRSEPVQLPDYATNEEKLPQERQLEIDKRFRLQWWLLGIVLLIIVLSFMILKDKSK